MQQVPNKDVGFCISELSQKMGRPGFEPGTNRLKAEYSTVELATLLHFVTF